MEERSIHNVVKGLVYNFGGTASEMDELALPFVNEFFHDLGNAGFQAQIDKPVWHRPPARYPFPRAEVDFTPLVVTIGIFLGSSIGAWAVEKVCDDIWVRSKRAFGNLKKKFNTLSRKKSGYGPPQLLIRFETYYENDGLSVVVEGVAKDAKELESIERLVPEAQKRALTWLENRGITAKMMTYTIKYGELSGIPRLSDE
jgi:hypothetical protein